MLFCADLISGASTNQGLFVLNTTFNTKEMLLRKGDAAPDVANAVVASFLGETIDQNNTALARGTIAGTGWVMGGAAVNALSVQSGGIVSPGDMSGRSIGTLNVGGDAIFKAGSETLMQVRLPTYNAPGSVDASDLNYVSWIIGLKNNEFSNALNTLVTTQQHDMVNVQSLAGAGSLRIEIGAKITLINEGYTPRAGDIFHLFKAGANGINGVLGSINVGNTSLRKYVVMPMRI